MPALTPAFCIGHGNPMNAIPKAKRRGVHMTAVSLTVMLFAGWGEAQRPAPAEQTQSMGMQGSIPDAATVSKTSAERSTGTNTATGTDRGTGTATVTGTLTEANTSAGTVTVTRDVACGTAPVNVPPSGAKTLLLDLYEPGTAEPAGDLRGPDEPPALRPLFLAVHGGAMGRGDKGTENMTELCREMAARGYLCASINYRMWHDDPPLPGATLMERVHAAAVEDAGTALRWLRDHADRYRLDTARVAVGGSSAGAEIVLRLAYGGTNPALAPRAVFSWSGGLDGREDLLDPGEPALFIVHGSADDAVSPAEADALTARAAQVGLAHEIYMCEGLGHTVPLDRRPEGRSLYDRLADFMEDQLGLGEPGRRLSAESAGTTSVSTETAASGRRATESLEAGAGRMSGPHRTTGHGSREPGGGEGGSATRGEVAGGTPAGASVGGAGASAGRPRRTDSTPMPCPR